MKLSAAEIDSLLFSEQASDPATPATGFGRIFVKSDGVYFIDDGGTVTGPFVASVESDTFAGVALTKTATQSAAGSGAATDITFDSELFDTDGFHDTASNTARITIPTGMGGKYRLTGSAELQSVAAGQQAMLRFTKNGGTQIGGRIRISNGAAAANMGMAIASLVDLAAGDYVTLNIINVDSVARNVGGDANQTTYFSAEKVG